jgi:hypothetical protein
MNTFKSLFFALFVLVGSSSAAFAGGDEALEFLEMEHHVILLATDGGEELDIQISEHKDNRTVRLAFQDAEARVNVTVFSYEDGIVYSNTVISKDFVHDFDFANMGSGKYYLLVEYKGQSVKRTYIVK